MWQRLFPVTSGHISRVLKAIFENVFVVVEKGLEYSAQIAPDSQGRGSSYRLFG